MRKKIFAILMSAMMMVTFMPAMAFADSVEEVNLKDFEHTCLSYHTHGVKKQTETVVAGDCKTDKYVKTTYECGDYNVESEGKGAHNYVVKEMELAEVEALATKQITNWVYDLAKIITGEKVLTNEEGVKLDKEGYEEKIAHLLLGISPSDAQLADEIAKEIGRAITEFKNAYKGNTGENTEAVGKQRSKLENTFAGLVASTTALVSKYFVNLGGKVATYAYDQSHPGKVVASEAVPYCYFLVKICDKCDDIQQIVAYDHSVPADMADCAISYECEHCHKVLTNRTSHFYDDAKAIIDQAKEVYTNVKDRDNNEIAQSISELANMMCFMDSTPHKLSVVSEKKACGEVYTISCSKCGESISYTLPTSLKHNFQWKTLVEADCSKVERLEGRTGLKVQVCEDCGAVNLLSFVEVEAKHNYVDMTFAPTCTLPGFTCKVCENCHNVLPLTSKDFTAPTGHDYDIQMVVDPSCGGNGLLKIACKNDKCRTSYYTDLKDADYVNISSWDELKESWFKYPESGIVKLVDKLHSTEKKEVAKFYFLGYDLDLVKNPIELSNPAATGHKFTKMVVAAEATCEQGTTWAPQCANCGLIDTKSDANYVLIDEASLLDHNYKAYEVEATCEHQAGTIKVCQNCGDEKCYNTKGFEVRKNVFYTGKKCLSDNEWVTIVEPTFTEVGMRATHCVHCGGICVREDVGVKKLAKAYQPTLKAGKKQFTVKFKNASKAATGYQIAYKVSGANNYKYVKTTFKNSKTVKNLKAGKKYTVKVRAYVEEAGKTVYGKWCAVKYVKVK